MSTTSRPEIIVSVGLSEAVFDGMTAILDEGEMKFRSEPGWLNYLNVPKLLGATSDHLYIKGRE
ncbi:MAG: hypothetical protein ACLVBJ_04075 [Pilosibacter sp.]